ncbi:family 16 glycoside hydrolase [Candidatus Poribacteria bacterium]
MRASKYSVLTKVGLGAFLLVWLAGSLAAQQAILEDNFDDGNADGWMVASGEWATEGKAFARLDSEKSYGKATTGDISWTDYIVEVDVTLLEDADATTNAAGLLIRSDENGDNGFRFWIRTDSSNAQFSKWADNAYEHIEGDIPLDIKVGETYHLKAIVEGQKYQCFVNDALVAEYEDTDKFLESGGIGLIAYNVYPHFDNVKVSSSVISAVQPEEKAATLWGSIKNMP